MVARRSGPVPGHVAELLARIGSDVDHLEGLLFDLRDTLEHGSALEEPEAFALAVTLSRIADASLAILDPLLRGRDKRDEEHQHQSFKERDACPECVSAELPWPCIGDGCPCEESAL